MEDLENLPRLCKMGSTWQLIVDGKPFLILGGQVQNSSMNSADYMRPLWKKLVGMGINTVLGPVAWEDIEPEENIFDFTELETILTDARSYGMRIVLLWFGSFKNGKDRPLESMCR
jgi:beta-galactosidase GanA